MFTHQLWTTRLLTASALCLATLAAPAQTANTLKVGVIGPFTGPSSDFGVQMLQGIQLATEEINAVGGYMGRPFELVIKDDQGTPDAGLKGSQELAAAGVVATLGFCNTGVAQKSLEVFQTAKLPLIIPCATGSPLTAKYPAPESYIFRTSARDAIQAPYVVEDIIRRGWSRVAIFADTTGYGDAGLKDVEAALAANLRTPSQSRLRQGVRLLKGGGITAPASLALSSALGVRLGGAPEVMAATFPTIAYLLSETRERSLARELLVSSYLTPPALRRAYLRTWRTHGDINFATVVQKLGLTLEETI